MPERHGSQVGHFCWFELATTDQVAAKKFYAELFGWTSDDYPMGPDSFYTMFKLNGRDAAGCYNLQPEMRAQGVPPHWMTYIAVASADDAAAKAESLGGTVVARAFDVFDIGRMAVLQDPGGATFSVWQPKSHRGASAMHEPNAFCWSELMTRDPNTAEKFYTSLFGWKAEKSKNPVGFDYTHWAVDGKQVGGMMAIAPDMGPIPPHWMNYIAVSDCDETVRRAGQLGGNAIRPAFDIPDVGRMAILMDGEGAAFAVIHLTNPKDM